MGRQVQDFGCGFSWFPEGFEPSQDPRDEKFRGQPVFWPKASCSGKQEPVVCDTHYYVPYLPATNDPKVTSKLRAGLAQAGFGEAVGLISQMSDDVLDSTAVNYTANLQSRAGISVPLSVQEEVRSVLYALAGRAPRKRFRAKQPNVPKVSDEEKARMANEAPDVSFVDNFKNDTAKSLPDGWWIGTTSLEKVDGTLEVIDHKVPIKANHTPSELEFSSYTGRRLVKLWTIEPFSRDHLTDGPEEAEKKAIPPGAAKARQVDHLRYEKGGTKAERSPLPPEHFISHEPADPRCPVCEAVKLTKGGAGKVDSGSGMEKNLEYLDLVGIDLYGPLPDPDIDGCYYFMVTDDVKTGLSKGESLAEKSAEAAWEAASTLYPGTRMDSPPTFPKAWSADNGGEWKEVFAQNTKERGGTIRLSIPYRSQTNARIERKIRSTQRGATAALLTSGLPRAWCFRAAKVYLFNRSRQDAPDGSKSAYFKAHNRDYATSTKPLLPFGCRVVVHDDDSGKHDPRGKEAVMVGYGPMGSIRALEVKPYVEEQCCKEIITRDYQAHRAEFPMKQHNIDPEQDHMSWSKIFDGETVWRPGTRVTTGGALVCTAPGCGKLVTEEEVTCQFCIDGVAHRKPDGKSTGRPGPGCLRSRCPGHQRPRLLVSEEEECQDDEYCAGPQRLTGDRGSSSGNRVADPGHATVQDAEEAPVSPPAPIVSAEATNIEMASEG